MRRFTLLVFLFLSFALTFGGCDEDEAPAGPSPQPTTDSHPTPTSSSTQTPEAGRPTEGGYELAEALPGANFDRMLALATLPGFPDGVTVVSQTGIIHRVSSTGSFEPTVFGDLSDRLIADPGNEEGLLGLAFSPRFDQDGRVYVYYTAGDPRRSVLSRFQVENAAMNMASERVILEIPQPFANHNGGQLVFGPDGYLYVGLGDGGSAGDPQGHAQDLTDLLGSILRIDVSGDGYRVPPDNPFFDSLNSEPQIFAYGLRNPWRFSFDRETGEIWAGDVGQGEWEEVDHIVAGANYGWNIMEGPECFQAESCDQTGLILPRAAYGHDLGCSITGGYVYRGQSMPELAGWYVYGDFCSGRIWAVNTADASDPVLLIDGGPPISSFAELPSGELLVLTFANAIYLLRQS